MMIIVWGLVAVDGAVVGVEVAIMAGGWVLRIMPRSWPRRRRMVIIA
jgi:hypothetical protein